MSEFLNDPLYHQHAPAEQTSAYEHITNAGGIIVDAVVVAFSGLSDIVRRITHPQAHL